MRRKSPDPQALPDLLTMIGYQFAGMDNTEESLQEVIEAGERIEAREADGS